MPKKALHPFEQMAIQWNHDEEQFFLDVDFSTSYFKLHSPLGKRNAWAVKSHGIGKSTNLESIYNDKFRKPGNQKIVPLMSMMIAVFGNDSFAPEELDLGKVVIHSEFKLSDSFGWLGNLQRSGWIISRRLLDILAQFNVGKFKAYKIAVNHKGINYDNYVYFHFLNYADTFIDYSKSSFYTQEGFLKFESRKPIVIHSAKDLKSQESTFTKTGKNLDICPKELFLTDNNLDLFKFKRPFLDEYFISKRLAERFVKEKVTGFELLQTTRVKKLGEGIPQ